MKCKKAKIHSQSQKMRNRSKGALILLILSHITLYRSPRLWLQCRCETGDSGGPALWHLKYVISRFFFLWLNIIGEGVLVVQNQKYSKYGICKHLFWVGTFQKENYLQKDNLLWNISTFNYVERIDYDV